MKERNNNLPNLLISLSALVLILLIISIFFAQNSARKRDQQRISDIHLIDSTLKLYFDNSKQFPDNSDNDCVGFDLGLKQSDPGEDNSFIMKLNENKSLLNIPLDPYKKAQDFNQCDNFVKTKNHYAYAYKKFTAGEYGCDKNKGAFYILGILNYESYDNSLEKSPGFSCPKLDFTQEFAWVTGRFEK